MMQISTTDADIAYTNGDSPNATAFRQGLRDGIPIGLGYFAVAFSLGIICRSSGLGVLQGFLASLLNNTSAGEFAAITLIGENATYMEVALVTLIANARYLLMSCALSQRLQTGESFIHRLARHEPFSRGLLLLCRSVYSRIHIGALSREAPKSKM